MIGRVLKAYFIVAKLPGAGKSGENRGERIINIWICCEMQNTEVQPRD